MSFFNSKKAEGEVKPTSEVIKVGFKKTDKVPITATMPPALSQEGLAKTGEPSKPKPAEPKLAVTSAPKKEMIIDRFKAIRNQNPTTSPTKPWNKGGAFQADHDIVESEVFEQDTKKSKGVDEGSRLAGDESIKATINSEKPSIEMRPPLDRQSFGRQGQSAKDDPRDEIKGKGSSGQGAPQLNKFKSHQIESSRGQEKPREDGGRPKKEAKGQAPQGGKEEAREAPGKKGKESGPGDRHEGGNPKGAGPQKPTGPGPEKGKWSDHDHDRNESGHPGKDGHPEVAKQDGRKLVNLPEISDDRSANPNDKGRKDRGRNPPPPQTQKGNPPQNREAKPNPTERNRPARRPQHVDEYVMKGPTPDCRHSDDSSSSRGKVDLGDNIFSVFDKR